MALPLELEPLHLELNPKICTADLRATLLTCGPIVAGLAFMYGPSFVDLFRHIWSTDAQAHGPIVFGVSCWLVWRNWPAMWARSEGVQTSAAGWPIVVFGLLLYIVGRSQEILMFEVGSLIWLLTGIRRKIKPQEKSPPAAHDHTLLTRPLNLGTLASA